MKKSDYVAIGYYVHPFMRELGLCRSLLSLYAAIYSFSMGGCGLYYGSQKYLAESIGISVRTVQRGLCRLREKNLIENAVSEDGKYTGIRALRPTDRELSANGRANGETPLPEKRSPEKRDSESASQEKKNAVSDGGESKARGESVPIEQIWTAEKREAAYERMIAKVYGECESSDRKLALLAYTNGKQNTPERFISHGECGIVRMTEAQTLRLLELVPFSELSRYIGRMEAMLLHNEESGKRCGTNHYRIIKKWIEDDSAL